MDESFPTPEFDDILPDEVPDELPEEAWDANLTQQIPAPEELDEPFDLFAAEEPDEAAVVSDETIESPEEDLPPLDLPEGAYEETNEGAYEEPFDDFYAEPEPAPEEALAEEPSEPDYTEPVEPTVVRRPPQEKRSAGRKALRVFAVIGKYLLAIILVAAILAAGLFGYLTVTEYTPAHAEVAEPGGVSISTPVTGGSFRIVTFNTGYAGLGESADFFMDGGKGNTPESEELVLKNMLGIETIVKNCEADFIFLQEVDTGSKRSYDQNQWLQYEHDLADYESRYALNYSCDYVPYPIPDTIGKVHSGIATYSRYNISSATRYSLPCPFTWPVRVANLKRAMLVSRIPIDGMEQEIVLINFHLEAYDDGEGKIAQTQQLMDFIQAEYEKGNFVIAGGDFNQTFPDTRDIFPMKDTTEWIPGTLDELPASWSYAYDKVVPTCRLLNQPFNPSSERTQYYIIDGFIVSPNIKIDRIEALDEGFVYSDHNPVVMDFTLSFESQSAEEATEAE